MSFAQMLLRGNVTLPFLATKLGRFTLRRSYLVGEAHEPVDEGGRVDVRPDEVGRQRQRGHQHDRAESSLKT